MSSQLDLTNCDKEPVAFINEIQSFGAIVILDASLKIVQASENIGEWLGVSAPDILGRDFCEFLSERQVSSIRAFSGAIAGTSTLPIGLVGAATKVNAIAHASDDLIVVEFEPRDLVPHTGSEDSGAGGLEGCLRSLATAETPAEVANILATCVKEVTGYDRVMVYMFHHDWHGEVIAEQTAPGVDKFLGHHFPASDIPEPARRLFASNWIRVISDVQKPPVSLHPKFPQGRYSPVDLTLSTLRQPSPIHVEYLKNMEVGASMTISVLLDGELWGLVACHHRTPRYQDYWMRSMCEFIGKYASDQLKRVTEGVGRSVVAKFSIIGQNLIEHDSSSILELVHDEAAAFFGASEVLFVTDQNKVLGRMDAIPQERLRELTEWLKANVNSQLFYTGRIVDTLPSFEPYAKFAAGVLSVKTGDGYLLIFRPEQVQEFTWGGNPTKSVEEVATRLHPRSSFEAWKQTVVGHSKRWTDSELVAARMLASLFDATTPERTPVNGDGDLAPKLRDSLKRSITLLGELSKDEMIEPVLSIRMQLLQSRYQEMLDVLKEAG
jgi:light-regulated signal transduction histidine kinase (bacteriophytochrome)